MDATQLTFANDKERGLEILHNFSASMKNRSESAKIDAMNAQKLTDLFVNQFQSPQMNPSQPKTITPVPSLALGDMFAPTDVSPTDDADSATAKLSAADSATAKLSAATANSAKSSGEAAAPRFVYPMAGPGMPQRWQNRREDDPMYKDFLAGK
jgi:hypothetical protein